MIRKLALGLATAAGALAAVEAGLRAARVAPPGSRHAPLEFVNLDFGSRFPLERDPQLFWKLTPGGEIPGAGERIGPQGFRGPRFEDPKPKDRRRLVCIGDSCTFGFGVDVDSTYCARLGRWLGPAWDAVNAGVTGYSSFQMRRFAETRLAALAPDAVVVYAGALNDYLPAIGAADAQAAALSDRWETAGRVLPLERLALFRWVRARFADSSASRPSGRERYARAFYIRGERPDGPRVPIANFRENLAAIEAAARAAGARVVFVVPPAPARTRASLADGDAYAAVVREAAASAGCARADARSRLAALAAEDALNFVDGIHPSERGHAFVAAAVARAFFDARVPGLRALPPELLVTPAVDLKGLQARAALLDGTGAPLDAAKHAGDDPALIVVPSPSTVRFEDLELPEGGALLLSLARRLLGPEDPPDPASRPARVEFVVKVVAEDGVPREVFRRAMTSAEGHWSPFEAARVDLSEWGRERVTLVLECQGNAYRACWGPARVEPFR